MINLYNTIVLVMIYNMKLIVSNATWKFSGDYLKLKIKFALFWSLCLSLLIKKVFCFSMILCVNKLFVRQ